jgi:hypothetical protein
VNVGERNFILRNIPKKPEKASTCNLNCFLGNQGLGFNFFVSVKGSIQKLQITIE